MKKRITALVLIMILVVIGISGCNKEEKNNSPTNPNKDKSTITERNNLNNNEQALGRYEEQDISLPEMTSEENIRHIVKNPNGQTEVYTMNISASKSDRYICYTLQEDETWVRSNAMWLNGDAVHNDAGISDIFINSNGDHYATYTVWGRDKENNPTMNPNIVVSTDGGKTADKLDIPYIKDAEIIIGKIVVMEDGTIIIADKFNYNNDAYLLTFSSNGDRLEDITELQNHSFIPYGNLIVGMNKDGTELVFYNIVTREIEKTIEYTLRNKETAFALHILEDETILLGDVNGIHRFSKDGTLWETTVDGWSSSMSKPNLNIKALFTSNKTDEYYAAYTDSANNYRLVHYSFNENIPAYPETEITVYSLTENKTVSSAISLYHAMNADVKVNYEVAMYREGESPSDFIRVLNTELLNGNGADVLILDGLPAKSYIEKGVLSDISDILLPLMESDELLPNITKNYMEDDKIYQMPLRFTVPIILGDKMALSSMSSVEEITNYIKNSETKLPFAPKITYDSLISDYLTLYSDDLFQEGKLSEEKYIAFLKNLKIIADNIGAEEYSDEKQYYHIDYLYDEWITDTPEYLFGCMDVRYFTLNGEPIVHTCTQQMKTLVNFAQLNTLVDAYDLEFNIINNAFIPSGMVGLNQASKESNTAKDFISFLFSYVIQQEQVYDGFPVNSNALKTRINRNTNDREWASDVGDFTGMENEHHSITVYWPTQEEKDRIREMISNVNVPMEPDFTLYNIIIEQSMPFFLGKADAKQAAAAVMAKVNTYQSE